MGSDAYVPLFETKKAKGRVIRRLFAMSIFVGIGFILVYRLSHRPRNGEDGRWAWIGLLGAELWFSLYWVLTQALRWNCVYRRTFKDRLSHRYEKDLPRVDIFVCTAEPKTEQPIMVVNTVLSVMAYDYPAEKLSVYLSDDAAHDITFYALIEASHFAKHWIPYCKKFYVEPGSPGAYFQSISEPHKAKDAKEFLAIKRLYEDMKNQIITAAKLGQIPEEVRSNYKGFLQWDSFSSQRDHDTILQILIDGKDPKAKDIDGCSLPTLVYLAREKRPQQPHNFKAGAMNALIRVSQTISNGQIILNVDCDMYSNNSNSVRDALCFFLDEKKGHEIAFVQFPQSFENITKNEIYDGSMRIGMDVEFHGMDGYGGPPYVGTGCFHRRNTLTGRKFDNVCMEEWKREETVDKIKALASCSYEENTQWGKEMGVKYGCPVEDVITGLSIQMKGWKSVYFNPERKAFLGVATTTLPQTLVQHKRWSAGDFLILFSSYSPAWYAHGKISFGLQLAYCCYCLWAPNCLATLYYTIIPSLYLLKGIFLFPKASSPWFIPFAYVFLANNLYSLAEFLWCGGTILGWWNSRRMWLYRRTSSYLFGFIDAVLMSVGFSQPAFEITAKVADEDVLERHEKEIMEFGPGASSSSPMFIILATLALFNLFCFVGLVAKVATGDANIRIDTLVLQILLCGILVLINWPLFQGILLRRDNGKMPSSITAKSIGLALFACTCSLFLK